MDRAARAPPYLAIKTDGNAPPPRTRRKLQKGGSRQRQQSLRRGSGESMENKSHNTIGRALVTATTTVATATRPSIPLPPDLSDSKWLEYVGRDGFLCSNIEPPLQSKEALPIPVAGNVPELSRLPSATPPRTPPMEPAGSTSTSSLDRPPTESSRSSLSASRRRAKTPVFAVGQLEELERRQASGLMQRPARNDGVERIAEQCRAILEPRASYLADARSEPRPSLEGDGQLGEVEHKTKRQRSSGDLQRQSLGHENGEAQQSPAAVSPQSDDGTLVSFEEETIYFKPMSFSPMATSPLRVNNHHHQAPPPLRPTTPASPPPDNLSLQICLDLLTRELASGMSGRPYRQSQDTSALQIWVMIEAYERLRGLLLDMPIRQEEAGSLQMMFDMWLRALYSIHDSMTGDMPRTSENYDGLEETLD